MNFKNFFFILLFLLFGYSSLSGQRILDRIETGLNSVINATALDRNGIPIKSAIAFFISNDGLAVTCSSFMEEADSIIFYDNNGRDIELNRIVAFHSFGNLALVHLKIPKSHNYSYLIPARISYNGETDILAFVNIGDAKDGLSYGKIEKIRNCIAGGRIATIKVQGGETSDCAPVISGNGDFIGIYRYSGNRERGMLMPVSYINDTTWVSANQTWTDFKSNPDKAHLTSTHYCQSIMFMADGKWLEASQQFTSCIKFEPENSSLYALRALCRYNYGNISGANSDFMQATEMNPDGYIPYYARAMSHIARKDSRKALTDLTIAIENNPDFAEAFLEIGKLQALGNDIQKAYASFSYALKTDTILAEAWYERGKLSLLHSSNMNNALKDLSTAARLDPWLDGVYALIGNIKLQQKNYWDAIIDLDKAIEKNPDDIHALMNRGMAYYNCGIQDKACDDWEEASKKGSTQAIKLISRYCTQIK